MSIDSYPWYAIVRGAEIHQGDIFEDCPVFIPPSVISDKAANIPFNREDFNVIVLSQTCDLVNNKCKNVIICPVWNLSEMATGYLATEKGKEDVRRGNLPAYHMLNKCDLNGYECENRIVEFQQIFTLPYIFLQERASNIKNHLRLLPPYREHLSQAFARFFMRVGLPVDIPSFKK